jgi:hypothetical protein
MIRLPRLQLALYAIDLCDVANPQPVDQRVVTETLANHTPVEV